MREVDWGKIQLLVLDVDGVMTDGSIILAPNGDEIKSFHVRDGSGIKYWYRVGKQAAIITGRGGQAVLQRARELSIETVRLDAKRKLPVYRQVLADLGLTPQQTAVIGDDLTDLPMLMECAFAVCVPEAPEEVRQRVDYITQTPGGRGAVREVIELLLRRAGLWERILQRYLDPEQEQA